MSRDSLKKLDLEIAGFCVGLFVNYLGFGAPHDEEASVQGIAAEWPVMWGIKNLKANIPLPHVGNMPQLSPTEIGDVARSTAVVCLLPRGAWREVFNFVSETNQNDKGAEIIEPLRGRVMEVACCPFKQIIEDEAKEAIVHAERA